MEGDGGGNGQDEHDKHQSAATALKTITGFAVAHSAGDVFTEETGQEECAEENARNRPIGCDALAPGAQPTNSAEDTNHEYNGQDDVGPIFLYSVQNAVNDFHNEICVLPDRLIA